MPGIALPQSGGVIASQLRVDTGVASIATQVPSAGYAGRSRLGRVGDAVFVLDSLGLIDGQTHYVVEIFIHQGRLAPLQNLLGFGVPDTLYDRAIF